MSNANKKKHLQPKKHRVQDALDFAKGYMMNVGSKNKALVQAQGHAKAAGSDETKNFWINIAGHIAKLAVFMMVTTGCSIEAKSVVNGELDSKLSVNCQAKDFIRDPSNISTIFECTYPGVKCFATSAGGISCFREQK